MNADQAWEFVAAQRLMVQPTTSYGNGEQWACYPKGQIGPVMLAETPLAAVTAFKRQHDAKALEEMLA